MTKFFTLSALLLVSLMVLLGCDNNDNNSSGFNIEVRKSIDEANAQFIELFNKSDSVGLAGMFTVDGKSMEPNEPSFVGRSAIQTHYSEVMNGGANKLGLVTTGLWGDKNMLVEEGEYTFTDISGEEIDKGKYIVLWKMEDGEWKLFRDIYNSDLTFQ